MILRESILHLKIRCCLEVWSPDQILLAGFQFYKQTEEQLKYHWNGYFVELQYFVLCALAIISLLQKLIQSDFILIDLQFSDKRHRIPTVLLHLSPASLSLQDNTSLDNPANKESKALLTTSSLSVTKTPNSTHLTFGSACFLRVKPTTLLILCT